MFRSASNTQAYNIYVYVLASDSQHEGNGVLSHMSQDSGWRKDKVQCVTYPSWQWHQNIQFLSVL